MTAEYLHLAVLILLHWLHWFQQPSSQSTLLLLCANIQIASMTSPMSCIPATAKCASGPRFKKHLPVKDTAACEYSKTECQSAVAQALLVAAACSKGLTQACLAQRNIAEHTALDLALHNAQWFMVQLLVTAGDCAAVHHQSNRFD